MPFAKKSLGQNFLSAPQVVDDIVKAAHITAGETIIEVGPGTGVLTIGLLKAGAHVIAVEKDDRLISHLHSLYTKGEYAHQFELIHGDILETPLDEITKGSYKVVANIPYYITGAIVRRFLSERKKPTCMVLMVQKEVADRIIARDGKESMLSISVKVYGTPDLVRKVGRGSFRPVPGVDSAVLRIDSIHSPFLSPEAESRFFAIVRAGFAQKRKKLSRNLETVASREAIAHAFTTLSMNESVRPEDLSPQDWLALAQHI